MGATESFHPTVDRMKSRHSEILIRDFAKFKPNHVLEIFDYWRSELRNSNLLSTGCNEAIDIT